MASSNNRDVQLVIRARDEAQRTIDAVADALNTLLGIQNRVADSSEDTASGLQQLGSVLSTLEKAYSKIDDTANRAAQAFERQQSSIQKSKADLQALQGQAAGAARAIDQLSTAIVDTRLAGGNIAPLVAQLQAAKKELASLGDRQAKLAGDVGRAEAALDGQRSSMQQIGSAAIGVADSMARAEAQTELQTAALREQAQAAQTLTAVQQRINDATGVSRPNADGTAAMAADVLRVVAARDAETQATIEQGRALTKVEQTQREINALVAPGLTRDTGWAQKLAADLEETARASRQAADAEMALVDQAARLRATIDPLANIQRKLNAELADAQRLYRAGAISATELAQAERVLAASAADAAEALNRQGKGANAKISMFGLKPYELTNLGYQVNDLVTQIASGTSVTQAFSQQIGQIIQLLPGLGSRIVGVLGNPVILAAAAGFAAVAIAIGKAVSQADRLRDFEGLLTASGDGANYQAKELAAAAVELDNYGASAENATKAIRALVTEGIDQSRIVDFGKAAQNLADVMGTDLVDASKQLATGLSAGYDAVKKLDDATNLFTSTEMDMIRTLFEEGRAQEARSRAADIAFKKLDEGADKQRGPWTDAIRKLGEAWNNFTTGLADTKGIEAAIWLVDKLGEGALAASEKLNGIQDKSRLLNEIMRLEALVSSAEAETGVDIFGMRARSISNVKEEIAELRRQYDALDAEEKRRSGDTITRDEAASNRADRIADIRAKSQEDNLEKLSGAQRVYEAGRLAFEEEMRKSGDEAIAQEQRKAAIKKEQAKVDKEALVAAKERARAEEAAIKGFSRKVVGPESSGNANATNPRSSATGLGQFIESTWLKLFRQHFPAEAQNMGREAILALRKDSTFAKKMIEVYARDNAEVLRKAGQSVTEANLYLTHFLGPNGALKVLKAAPNTPVDQLVSADAMRDNPEYLRTNGRNSRARTAGELRSFIADKIGDSSTAQSEAAQRLVALEDQRADKQRKFAEGVEKENAERTLTTAALQSQQGLVGEALILKERQQAIDEAILAKEQQIAAINSDLVANGQQAIKFTEAERAAITQTVGAYFDLARAKDIANARRAAVEDPVRDLTSQRDALQQQIEFYTKLGQSGMADQLKPALDETNRLLTEAIDKAKQFWIAMGGDPVQMANLGVTAEQVQGIITGLENARLGAQSFGRVLGIEVVDLAQRFSQGVTNAFDNFFQMVGEGKNVIRSLGVAFLQFAADFLRQIAMMILQQQAYNLALLIARLLGGGPAPTGGGGTGAIGGLQAHDGAVVGKSGTFRLMNPAWFHNARRMHGGGIVGLRPDEMPAILQLGEEVITRDDPRHVLNGGGSGGSGAGTGGGGIKQVLVLDPNEIAGAMQSSSGQRAVLTVIRANKETIRQELDV